MSNSNFEQKLATYTNAIEQRLQSYFTTVENGVESLKNAVRYSLLAGGKRVRPVLTLEFARLCKLDWQNALDIACAVELIHTYSLIHDDLPCMDNDDMRRGKPSCHKAFGEGVALLAGDALLTHSFGLIAKSAPCKISYENACKITALFSSHAGIDGMIGGQMIDISHEGVPMAQGTLEKMELLKTSALISLACKAGCIAGSASDNLVHSADQFAQNLGLAFQVIDDILDVEGDEKLLGKAVGSDNKQSKTTYVSLLGIDGARELSQTLTSKAINALDSFEDNFFLKEFSYSLLGRNF